mmetsp:Transcript_92967/g.249380  ORF Transcript_92967/g.249380 Transcript_92967/m.249380 type:complete len:241 (+) Transcript_92967:423-1145(+)
MRTFPDRGGTRAVCASCSLAASSAPPVRRWPQRWRATFNGSSPRRECCGISTPPRCLMRRICWAPAPRTQWRPTSRRWYTLQCWFAPRAVSPCGPAWRAAAGWCCRRRIRLAPRGPGSRQTSGATGLGPGRRFSAQRSWSGTASISAGRGRGSSGCARTRRPLGWRAGLGAGAASTGDWLSGHTPGREGVAVSHAARPGQAEQPSFSRKCGPGCQRERDYGLQSSVRLRDLLPKSWAGVS